MAYPALRSGVQARPESRRLAREVARAGGYLRYLRSQGLLVRFAFWRQLTASCLRNFALTTRLVAISRERGALHLILRALVHRSLLNIRAKPKAMR